MTTLNSVPNGLLSTVDATGTLNIQTNSVNALAIDNNQNATMNYVSAQNTFGFKNRIINGAMVIDQRNNGASVTPNGVYTLDRWSYSPSQNSKVTVQQNAGSVTPPPGFTNYLGATVVSSYTVGANDYNQIYQVIEGYNIADLGWGTANAKPVTVSFWVQSSLTGTFGATLRNSGLSRSYAFTYSITVANTWTQIFVTIPGDTSGTWNTTNGQGIYLTFSLGAGSNFAGAAGNWAGINYAGVTGTVQLVQTNGATFYLTGVQFEKGIMATPFEYRDYFRELAMCKRYFQYAVNSGRAYTSDGYWGIGFPFSVEMRTTPSTFTFVTGGTNNIGSPAGAINISQYEGNFQWQPGSAGTYYVYGAKVKAEAEL